MELLNNMLMLILILRKDFVTCKSYRGSHESTPLVETETQFSKKESENEMIDNYDSV